MTGCVATDWDLFSAGVLEGLERAVTTPDLTDVDHIVVWSSGGKDSEVSLSEVVAECGRQDYPLDRVTVAHNNLGHEVEWHGTLDLAWRQAARYGLRFVAVRRSDGMLLIDHVARKGMWPDQKRRWCTSDHKRGPGRTVLTRIVGQINAERPLGRPARLLQIYGFRAAESPARARKQVYGYDEGSSGKGTVRKVWNWLPIFDLSDEQVWQRIHAENLAYHFAYARGMSRLSCTFCVLAGERDLVTAARLQPLKAARYLQVEQQTGHHFKETLTMRDVVRAAGWDERDLAAMLAGDLPVPVCPACAAGSPPGRLHDVPDDVAQAMYGRTGLRCNGSWYYLGDTLMPVSPYAGLLPDVDTLAVTR